MIVTFLGTGTSQGVPVIACECDICQSLDFRDKRLRTSVHVDIDGVSIVIDTGPDFRQQMLQARIKKLDAILFTHAHKDHTAGMDDIRSFNFIQKKDMPVYAREDVIEQLKKEFSYIFEEVQYPGVPKVDVRYIDNAPFTVEGVKIIPISTMHYKLPVLGFRVHDFVYITDTNYISDVEKEKIKGCHTLVVNALQRETHISHYNLDEAIALVQELDPKKSYFTHISHKMGLHKETEALLPDNVYIAYDGLKLELD